MTITLNIRPEVEAELSRKANLAGRAVEVYAAELLEDATSLPAARAAEESGQALIEVCAKVRGVLTDEAIDTMFSRNPSTSRRVEFE